MEACRVTPVPRDPRDAGLAYAVHSFRLPFADAGASAIYVGTTPNQTEEVLKIIREQLELVVDAEGLTDEELDEGQGPRQGVRWPSASRMRTAG